MEVKNLSAKPKKIKKVATKQNKQKLKRLVRIPAKQDDKKCGGCGKSFKKEELVKHITLKGKIRILCVKCLVLYMAQHTFSNDKKVFNRLPLKTQRDYVRKNPCFAFLYIKNLQQFSSRRKSY